MFMGYITYFSYVTGVSLCSWDFIYAIGVGLCSWNSFTISVMLLGSACVHGLHLIYTQRQ